MNKDEDQQLQLIARDTFIFNCQGFLLSQFFQTPIDIIVILCCLLRRKWPAGMERGRKKEELLKRIVGNLPRMYKREPNPRKHI